ncbi:hypothetical protein AKO1_011871 [Acrasis kona]|uniref:Uncharacterized protein n=1 Tax=Acrasis kona TaxID=1008807 RepID=A0AAW2Z4E6_9EUKA
MMSRRTDEVKVALDHAKSNMHEMNEKYNTSFAGYIQNKNEHEKGLDDIHKILRKYLDLPSLDFNIPSETTLEPELQMINHNIVNVSDMLPKYEKIKLYEQGLKNEITKLNELFLKIHESTKNLHFPSDLYQIDPKLKKKMDDTFKSLNEIKNLPESDGPSQQDTSLIIDQLNSTLNELNKLCNQTIDRMHQAEKSFSEKIMLSSSLDTFRTKRSTITKFDCITPAYYITLLEIQRRIQFKNIFEKRIKLMNEQLQQEFREEARQQRLYLKYIRRYLPQGFWPEIFDLSFECPQVTISDLRPMPQINIDHQEILKKKGHLFSKIFVQNEYEREHVEDLVNSIDYIKAQNENLDISVDQLKSQIEELKSRHEKELLSKQSEVNNLEKKLATMSQQLKMTQDESTKLSLQLEASRIDSESKSQTLNQKMNEINHETIILKTLNQQYRKESEEKTTNLQQELKKTNALLDSSKQYNENLKQQLSKQLQEHSNLTMERSKLESTNRDLSNQINILTLNNTSLKEDSETLNRNNLDLQTRVDELQCELLSTSTNLTKLDQSLQKQVQTLKDHEVLQNKRIKKMELISKEKEKHFNDQVKSLEVQLEEVNSICNAKQGELDSILLSARLSEENHQKLNDVLADFFKGLIFCADVVDARRASSNLQNIVDTQDYIHLNDETFSEFLQYIARNIK